jgi:hypothetical protein
MIQMEALIVMKSAKDQELKEKEGLLRKSKERTLN